ncbi:hypothetical protein TcWFU_005859 [Taenia crassiceps]|uniref:Uncharacterized protein n=1 Tax=Taenia crassiceps TaxID=6207 RepID=A0ABR4Q1V5_9CEST
MAALATVAWVQRGEEPGNSLDQREGRPPPLLHDVIIHYGERLAVDESVNQISAAIRAINGSKPPATPETASSSAAASGATGAVTATDDGCGDASPVNPPTQIPAPAKPIPAPGDSTSDVDADSAPVSLILVIGTSLTVLRSYSFLWPRGLRRCLSAGTKGGDGSTRSPKRPRLSPDPETPTTLTTPTKTGTETVVSDDRMEGCELAIINMQRTCKDGLATFVSRRECDDLLRETVEGCLGLSLPSYDAMWKFTNNMGKNLYLLGFLQAVVPNHSLQSLSNLTGSCHK